MNYPKPAHLEALRSADGHCQFHGGLKGLEKESLRVDPHGHLALTEHPDALGSTLTHPQITTDYSEALLEFITPPFADSAATIDDLMNVQRFVYQNLDNELLWATSMPCILEADDEIPIAWYGTSNVGMMKHIYRRGLGHRYGRRMQTISGVHFNYSVPEVFWPAWRDVSGFEGSDFALRTTSYFALIRNFQRVGWIIPYLFGASPAVCRSFLPEGFNGFERFDRHTLYLPHATSLRMSDIGYKNKVQAALNISYNSLDAYVDSLTYAIETPWKDYDRIGVKVDGEYRQLNNHILQIENEYYSFIRPKNIARSGEKPTHALKRGGVKYIEVRALDVNAFEPAGVNREQLDFLEVFLVFCLVTESPMIRPVEQAEINYNQERVAIRGRQPGLTLKRGGRDVLLKDWVLEMIDVMRPVAELLDGCENGNRYSRALDNTRELAAHPEMTPSARMLDEMRERNESFNAFALRKSIEHQQAHLAEPLSDELAARYKREAEESLAERKRLEESETSDFDTYLADYFSRQFDEA
ncbi:MAG: glutamate--cysteine ligase [Gammaproteobacteria bacterium]|nr:glutamate--cysteine ligase [Gammaproteobacteria bacterium]